MTAPVRAPDRPTAEQAESARRRPATETHDPAGLFARSGTDPAAAEGLQQLVGNEAVGAMHEQSRPDTAAGPPPAAPPPEGTPPADGPPGLGPPRTASATEASPVTSPTAGPSPAALAAGPSPVTSLAAGSLAAASPTLAPSPADPAEPGPSPADSAGPGPSPAASPAPGPSPATSAPPGPSPSPSPAGPSAASGAPSPAAAGPAPHSPAPAGHAVEESAGEPGAAAASIDVELAEHQRWAQAEAVAGAAESPERAAFLADRAGAGLIHGLGEGFTGALTMGIGTQIAEHCVPIPGVGLVIGGYFALKGIVENWDHTVASISAIGQGDDFYEQAANTLAGIATIIDLIVNVLNVIGGIAGAISIAMWIITMITLGAATPLAATITAIAGAVLLAAGIANGILQATIQPVVAMFRAMHAFKSQADPRSVVAQGAQIQSATGIMGGQLGGLAGMGLLMAAHEGGESRPPVEPELPPSAAGEPPSVQFEPPAAEGSPIELGEATGAPAESVPGYGEIPVETGEGPPLELGEATGAPAESVPGHGEIPLEAGAGPPVELDSGTAEPAGSTPGEPVAEDSGNDLFGDGEFIWAEPYEGPAGSEPPVEITTTEARMQEVLDVAESGEVRGMHTDEALNDAHTDAMGRRRPGPAGSPRQEFNNQRARMDLPADAQGPIHHFRFPIGANAAEATSAGNLYATETGSRAHQAMHSAFGAEGRPYQAMEPGFNEPGMQNFFDFANTSPVREPIVPGEPTTSAGGGAAGTTPGATAESATTPAEHASAAAGTPATADSPQAGDQTPAGSADGPPLELDTASPGQESPSPHGEIDLPPGDGPVPELDTPPARVAADEPPRVRVATDDPQRVRIATDDPQRVRVATDEPERVRVATDEPRRIRVTTGETSETAGHEIPEEAESAPRRRLRHLPLPGGGPGTGGPTGNGPTGPGGPGTSGGPLTSYLTGALPGERDQRPGVTVDPATGAGAELVDPQYRNPPGTPQQIAAIRQEIAALRRERVQAAQARSVADRQRAQAGSLVQAAGQAREVTTEGSRRATQAQQDASQREGVNQQGQAQQSEAHSTVASYPERAAGLAVLNQPLAGFRGFLHFARMLPGDVGAKFHQMDAEAARFQRSLGQVGAQMARTAAQGPGALARWQQDQQALVASRTQAAGAQQTFERQNEQAAQISERATQARTQREAASSRAAAHEQQTGQQIDQRETRATTLAGQLAEWAEDHRAARIRAIAATRAKYEARGYRVTIRGE